MSWASKLIKPYRIEHGKKFRLKDFDPEDTGTDHSKKKATELLLQGVADMASLQDKLYAENRWGVLLIFQAMDAAGKDGAIKHVMSGVNPQGCDVYSFKTPSAEELNHDYLWRSNVRLPSRGKIGIFNRSYYEEVLIARVHPQILAAQKLPPALVTKHIWKERYADIHAFEDYLARNGFVVRKFFLNLSKKEQKKRFLERLDHPEKNWKFSAGDLHERDYWDDYMSAYEEMIRHTSSEHSPWYVIPADNKWFSRVAVAAAIVETLEGLNLAYPKVSAQMRKDLVQAKRDLMADAKPHNRKS
jgi:PPK2 family polyphosphate:nucleotide phosphotransferase